jgi:hypothetical protein
MSDAVWLAIIGLIYMVVKELLDSRRSSLARADIQEVKENVVTIEKATNSMKDALVHATKEAAFSAGKEQGRADQKAEPLPPLPHD